MHHDPSSRFERSHPQSRENDKFSVVEQAKEIQSSFDGVCIQAEQKLVADSVKVTPSRLVGRMLQIQRTKLESEDAQDLKSSTYAAEHTLLAIISSLEAAKSTKLLNDDTIRMKRSEIREHKLVAANFNQDLHNSMFYAQGELAEKYLQLFHVLMRSFAGKVGIDSSEIMSQKEVEGCVKGIGYEVAVHRALAYPSEINGTEYTVRASNAEEDLRGADIVIECIREGKAKTVSLDVKARGAFLAKIRSLGYIEGPALKLGIVTADDSLTHPKYVLNGGSFGHLEGFDFPQDGRRVLRNRVASKLFN